MEKPEDCPIILKTMGSFLFGGTVNRTQKGDSFHVDHGYAQFYIPQNARTYPLIFWHGFGQSGRSWESTPDGREGFQAIFTRRDWTVYIIDQPRRGRAGRTQTAKDAIMTQKDSSAWDTFRIGVWNPPQPASVFAHSQFPHDPASVEQFFRQQTSNTGDEPLTPEHRWFLGKTMAELIKKTGAAILFTHSNSGQYGWYAGMSVKPNNIKAIIAFEPASFVFPKDEKPDPILSPLDLVNQRIAPQMIEPAEFQKLTSIPILIIYGDNIAKEPGKSVNSEIWRIAEKRSKQFVEALNRHNGDAQMISLPERGIRGNTHAAFADINNLQIAEIVEKFLHEKNLDGRS